MKKILIVGAGFLQSFVIQKAKQMGYNVLAVDADPQAVGFAYADGHRVINIVDEEACLNYAKEEKIDGVLTAATDYGVLTAAYIAQRMGLPGLNYGVAKLIKNKYEVRKCLYEHRVDDTEQAYEVCKGTNLEEICQNIKFPVMVKPCDGSGSRGASKVECAKELLPAVDAAIASSLTHRALIETFIDGVEYGAESLVVNGKVHVLGIMRKWMTKPPYYAELGHAIPADLHAKVEERAKECVQKAIEALEINFGSVNMDIMITREGSVHIVDIGARMGGNMIGPCIIPYGTGVDYVGNMIKNAVGDEVDFTPKEKYAVATRLLAFPNCVVNKMPDFEGLKKEYGVEIYHHMKLGQIVNEYHTNLDGLGYIVMKSDNIDSAINNAEVVLNKIIETICS